MRHRMTAVALMASVSLPIQFLTRHRSPGSGYAWRPTQPSSILQAAQGRRNRLTVPGPGRSPMVMRREGPGQARTPTPIALSRAVSETDLKNLDAEAEGEDGMWEAESFCGY